MSNRLGALARQVVYAPGVADEQEPTPDDTEAQPGGVTAAAQRLHGPVAFTAAARRIDISTRDGRSLIGKPEGREQDAWAYFDSVPEVKFASRFMGNALSRIRIYPGIVVDPDEPPVPLTDAVGVEGSGVTEALATAAATELERITNTDDGMAGLMRDWGVNLSVAGDSYLIGRDDPDSENVDEGDPTSSERWDVWAASAIEVKGTKTIVHEKPGDKGIVLPDNALVYRIWRRHPQWRGTADSNLFSVLDVCEELLIYARQFRAIAKSRISAGILCIPSELSLHNNPRATTGQTPAPDEAGSPQGEGPQNQLTPFQKALVEAFLTPVEDDGSPAGVMPMGVEGKAEHLKELRHLVLERPIDKEAINRIVHLIQRLAHGLDLPVEVLTGLADANHWTGWLIEDSTYKAHVEPLAMIPAAGLASAFLRPALRLQSKTVAGIDLDVVRRVVIGLDPAALVARPNRGQDARDAYAAGVINGEALRRYLGFADTDAPDMLEQIRRYVLERGIGSVKLTAALMEQAGLVAEGSLGDVSDSAGSSTADGGSEGAGDGGDATEGGSPTPATEPARGLLAAAAEVPGFGDRLGLLETRLRDRLQVAASDAVAEALRRAGNKLRNAAARDRAMREQTRAVEPEQVGVTIGAAAAAQLVGDVDSLITAADFDALTARWDAWVGDAQSEIARLLEAQADEDADQATAAASIAAYEQAAPGNRDAGWLVLLSGLLTLARTQLFEDGTAVVQGEYDPTVRVQAGLVRDALSRAGGLDRPIAPSGPVQNAAPGGLTTGPDIREALAGLDLTVSAYRWDVGAPSRPFEPHQALAGVTFTSWDDMVLLNNGSWPPSPFFYAGDHDGCQCGATPVVVRLSVLDDVALAAA